MKYFILLGLSLIALSTIGEVYSYELSTHARLSNVAFQRSILRDPVFMLDIGLDPSDPAPFNDTYFDVSGSIVYERPRSAFEEGYMPDAAKPLSISGWLMRGAIREDDWTGGPNPWVVDPDLPVSIVRVANHFFDPIYRRGLTYITTGEMAPQWAMGSTDIFNQPNQPKIGRANHYSVFDAREAMYRALTGRSSDGSALSASGKSPKDIRKAYWATAFRSLGDVVHLVQDMAQPQHTRNDSHSGLPFGGEKSFYEKYIEKLALATPQWNPAGPFIPPKTLNYAGYPTPALSNYLAYFSSSKTDSYIFDRKGLADYSNRSFFTIGKNFENLDYDYPRNFPLTREACSDPTGIWWCLLADLPDSLGNPPALRVPIASKSIWSRGAEATTGSSVYTLTTRNYNAMADLLIPRAVAYSAGIINYFFRGKIDLVDDPSHPGAFILKNLGDEQMKGNFTLYYDTVDGNRYPVGGDTPTITWADRTIEAHSQIDNLMFAPPAISEFPGQYMLVFNGDMGEEKAAPGLTAGAVVGKLIGGEPYLYLENSDTGLIGKMSPNGDFSPQFTQVSDGHFATKLSVYKTDVFELFEAYVTAEGGMLSLNGNVVFNFTGSSYGTAANKDNIFVTEVYGDTHGSAQVNVFDHAGGLRSILQTNPDFEFLGGPVRIAANNTHFATTHNEYLYIYTKDGGNVAAISGLNIFSQEVAMTKDRVYYANGGEDSLTMQVYDLYGGLQNTIDLTGIVSGGLGCIAATENRLYIGEWRPTRLHIYKRNVIRNLAGNIISDGYVYWKAVSVGSFNSCAVDAAYLK